MSDENPQQLLTGNEGIALRPFKHGETGMRHTARRTSAAVPLAAAAALLFPALSFAQVDRTSDLYAALKAGDSLLFDVGFNTCDIGQFENLVSEDFEFYHDQSGMVSSKAEFIAGIKEGLCRLDYKPRRELTEGSLTVFPLQRNGVVYGAIQMGEHRFYAREEGKPEYPTSTAKFTHLWLLEEGEWKLSRGLSYDHQEPEETGN